MHLDLACCSIDNQAHLVIKDFGIRQASYRNKVDVVVIEEEIIRDAQTVAVSL